MPGLSPLPEPPPDLRRPGEYQFSLAQLLSLMLGISVLCALGHLALSTNLTSPAAVWMVLIAWLGAVAALCATNLLRTPLQIVLAGVIAAMIAAFALMT